MTSAAPDPVARRLRPLYNVDAATRTRSASNPALRLSSEQLALVSEVQRVERAELDVVIRALTLPTSTLSEWRSAHHSHVNKGAARSLSASDRTCTTDTDSPRTDSAPASPSSGRSSKQARTGGKLSSRSKRSRRTKVLCHSVRGDRTPSPSRTRAQRSKSLSATAAAVLARIPPLDLPTASDTSWAQEQAAIVSILTSPTTEQPQKKTHDALRKTRRVLRRSHGSVNPQTLPKPLPPAEVWESMVVRGDLNAFGVLRYRCDHARGHYHEGHAQEGAVDVAGMEAYVARQRSASGTRTRRVSVSPPTSPLFAPTPVARDADPLRQPVLLAYDSMRLCADLYNQLFRCETMPALVSGYMCYDLRTYASATLLVQASQCTLPPDTWDPSMHAPLTRANVHTAPHSTGAPPPDTTPPDSPLATHSPGRAPSDWPPNTSPLFLAALDISLGPALTPLERARRIGRCFCNLHARQHGYMRPY